MSRSARATGLTLIELLVVVAIVVVLVSLLLPALGAARQQARTLVCASNLRQIGVAWGVYKDDHKGEYPAGKNISLKFRSPLESYMHGRGHASQTAPDGAAAADQRPEVFRCPGDDARWPRQTARDIKNSYRMSPVLMGKRYDNSKPPWHIVNSPRLAVWPALDERVRKARIIEPTVNSAKLVTGGDFDWWLAIDQRPEIRTDEYNFHGDRDSNNLLFFDGHVQFLPQYHRFFITPRYTLNPYRDLIPSAKELDLIGP